MSNNSHNHDPIYNQDDMDSVLAKLRAAGRENELTHQLLWAIVQAAGGEITVPYNTWAEGNPNREIIMWDDPETYVMHLKIKEVSDV